VAEHDQFNPPDAARATTAEWRATDVTSISGADHFLNGRLSHVAEGCVDFTRSLA
jgi:alpha/beta superfamily hydrolase